MFEKILVLMSTYNGEKYLQEQLDSILAQKNVKVDILVRDDGSTDSTVSVIKKAIQNYPERVFLVQGPNLGYARSFTELLEMAEKEYVDYDYYAFSDQDDVWLSQKLNQAILKLEKEKTELSYEALGYCSNLTCVDSQLNIISPKFRKKLDEITDISIILNPMCTGCTMVFNMKAIQLYTYYSNHFYLKYHDYLMGLICFYLGKLVYDDESYIYYRQHGGNQIGAKWSFSQRMLTRLQHLRFGEKNIVEKTCSNFLLAYGNLLSVDKLQNIRKIAQYKKGINRWKLILSKEVSADSFERSFFLKCKIIFGQL